ncbi:MAG TPA: phosphoribosyltransferase [Steroidobacteraceae bacterium]
MRKSSTARGAQRPSLQQHYESLAVTRAPERVPERLLLIDDVVSTGRTLLACWMRLRERFPHTPIAAFALIRTLGFVRATPRLVVPCVGRITWTGVDARRYP